MNRRHFLLGTAGMAAACRRARAPRYNGYAFTSTADRQIAAVSLSNFSLVHQIPVDSAPGPLLAHPARKRVMALLPKTGTLLEIDPRSMAIARRSHPLGPALDMRLARDGRLLWVLLRDSVIAWDLDRWQRVTWIKLPNEPSGMDLHPSGRKAAIGIPGKSAVGLANLDTGQLTITPLSEAPGFVCFQCKGERIFAALPAARRIAAVNTATARHEVDLPVPLTPQFYCNNDDGGQMFVTGEGMDAVVIVSPYQTEVGETVLAGHAPKAMAATAGRTPYLLLANPDAEGATILSINTRRVVAQVQTGGRASEIALTPDGSYALILNGETGNLAVFRLSVLQTANLQERRSRNAPLFTVIPVGANSTGLAICPLG